MALGSVQENVVSRSLLREAGVRAWCSLVVVAPEEAGLAKPPTAKSMTLLAEALLEIAFVIHAVLTG